MPEEDKPKEPKPPKKRPAHPEPVPKFEDRGAATLSESQSRKGSPKKPKSGGSGKESGKGGGTGRQSGKG